MRRIIQLYDSTAQMWTNLDLFNEYAGQNGTWESREPGILNYSSGTFTSRPWGVDLHSRDRRDGPVLVARLLAFWRVSGLYCKDKGKAHILQGNQLENDDEGNWKWWS